MDIYHRWLYDGSPDKPSSSEDLLSNDGPTDPKETMKHATRAFLDKKSLLKLCDAVRANLQESKVMGPEGNHVMAFLGDVVKDEYGGHEAIEFETIRDARLDKLLADIISRENRPIPTPTKVRADISITECLERQWRARFRQEYFDIDQKRYLALPTTDLLRDVTFDPQIEDERQLWRANIRDLPSAGEGNLQFEPGHWWLNLACAHRDGIVGSTMEAPTKTTYGATTLPLMTGREYMNSSDHIIRYVKEGKSSDMPVSLVSQVGAQIRILRGHYLSSPLAPAAGVRYDGLYILRQYGQKRDQQTGLHRLCLRLEYVEKEQPLIADLKKIPQPSQLDDWRLFENYEGEMVRRKRGDRGFLDWKMAKAQERMAQEQSKRTMQLSQELNLVELNIDQNKSAPVLSDTNSNNGE